MYLFIYILPFTCHVMRVIRWYKNTVHPMAKYPYARPEERNSLEIMVKQHIKFKIRNISIDSKQNRESNERYSTPELLVSDRGNLEVFRIPMRVA